MTPPVSFALGALVGILMAAGPLLFLMMARNAEANYVHERIEEDRDRV